MAAPTVYDKRNKVGGDAPTRHHLIVLGRDGAAPRVLPSAGELTIGRDEDADVRIIDPRASRQHARISIGAKIAIEDLGSANGTYLRDQQLPPHTAVPLERGDVVTIGGTMLMLAGGDPEVDGRRVWAHGYFEARLIEESARAASRGSELALARIHVRGQASAALVEEIASAKLHDGDLLAAYAPGEYELLLPESGSARAQALTEEIVAALAASGIASNVGLASFPADGTSPQALLGRAGERVRQPAAGVTTSTGTGIVVESGVMRDLYAFARRAAAGNSNVLIVGETGSGKEVLAEAVHRASSRSSKPLVALNCAALSETLVESELFGYERGAFTGANQAKVGLVEAASGGTLFLDEIGEMPLAIQAKLLRVIEARQVLRVGATQTRAVDVRIVAATNRDLEEEVAEKRFREDLYFRLNVITLEIPPLRERSEEVEALAALFLARLAEPLKAPPPRLSAEALACLKSYGWPGNIRELRNMIERAFVLCAGPEITPEHLPLEKMRRPRRVTGEVVAPPGTTSDPSSSPAPSRAGASASAESPRVLKDLERQAIVDALARCHFNQTRAAELLGMPRRTFCKRMKEYGIPRPRV